MTNEVVGSSTALFIAKIAFPTEILMKLLVPFKPSTVLPDAYQIAAPAVVWYSPEYVAPLSWKVVLPVNVRLLLQKVVALPL